jgi:hypothetical protein
MTTENRNRFCCDGLCSQGRNCPRYTRSVQDPSARPPVEKGDGWGVLGLFGVACGAVTIIAVIVFAVFQGPM